MPRAQADSPAPQGVGRGAATQEMRDAKATGPRNVIEERLGFGGARVREFGREHLAPASTTRRQARSQGCSQQLGSRLHRH